MLDLFIKGGPIMWPLLLASVIALTVTIDRLVFLLRERARRNPGVVEAMLDQVEDGNIEGAIAIGDASSDFIARALVYGLRHREKSLANAMLHAASRELHRYSRGLSMLDTIITLAPLLGLLGTVTGMISAFGLIGNSELEAPTVITGGVAEALIATAFGLGIAITALVPFNYLNARLEESRQEMQDAATHVELHVARVDSTQGKG